MQDDQYRKWLGIWFTQFKTQCNMNIICHVLLFEYHISQSSLKILEKELYISLLSNRWVLWTIKVDRHKHDRTCSLCYYSQLEQDEPNK